MNPPHRPYWSDPLTWISHLGIFVFGIGLATLGAILPSLFESIRLNPAEAGSLFLFLNLGSLAATLFGGPAFDRHGYRAILALSAVACASGLAWLAEAGAYPALAGGSFLLGLGGGGLNVGSNALVADLHPDRPGVALNRIGIFFGLGTFTIPILIGSLLTRLGLQGILLSAAGLTFVSAVVFATARFPAAKHSGGFPVTQAAKMLRDPFVLLLAVLLFFESGNEIATSGWLTTFAVDQLGASTSGASFYLSVLWGALVLGRLAASWVLTRYRPESVVQASALGAGFALAILVIAGGPASGFLLSGALGFSMAFIFPTVMGQASSRYPALSGTVLGALITVALTGGMLMPWLAGVVSSSAGVRAGLALPCVGFLAVAILQGLARRR